MTEESNNGQPQNSPHEESPLKDLSFTTRQLALVKNLAEGQSVSEAAVAAGYSDKNPRQSGHQALEQIKHTMPGLLDAYGLTEEVLIDKYLRRGLDAKETVFAKFNGKITDQREVPAWAIQKDFLDMTFRLRGSYARAGEAQVSVSLSIGDMVRDTFKAELEGFETLKLSAMEENEGRPK